MSMLFRDVASTLAVTEAPDRHQSLQALKHVNKYIRVRPTCKCTHTRQLILIQNHKMEHTPINKSDGFWLSDVRGTLASGASVLLRPELLATDSSSLSASSLLRRLTTMPLPSLANIELHVTIQNWRLYRYLNTIRNTVIPATDTTYFHINSPIPINACQKTHSSTNLAKDLPVTMAPTYGIDYL